MSGFRASFFSNHPLFILDHNSLDILDVNDYATKFYGYSREEFKKMNISDLGDQKDRGDLLNLEGSDRFANDKIWIHKKASGEKAYVQFTSHMFNHHEKPAKLAIAHDVSEQVQKRETENIKFPRLELYRGDRALAEIVWDGKKRVKKWSDKAETLFGWTKQDTIDKPGFFDTFIYGKELDEAYESIATKVEATKSNYTTYGRVRTKQGDIRMCEWHNTLLYDEAGELVTVYTLIQDVSDRKESEYLFKALSEKSLVGVYLIQDDIFKYINPRFAEIFGYEREQVENILGPSDLTHPADRERVFENLKKRYLGETDSLNYNFRCVTKNNEPIHVQVFGTRIEYKGKPAVVGTLLDVTHSKLAYERYQASVESFEDLFDSISDAIFILDKQRFFIKVNDAAVEVSGYERDFLLGKTPDLLSAPGKVDVNETRAYFDKALKGEAQHYKQWGVRKSGEVFPAEIFLTPGTYFGEEVAIAIVRDVSDKHEIEDQIQKSEERFRQLFQNAPFGIVMMNKHQDVRRANKAFENMFHFKGKEIEGIDIDSLIIPSFDKDSARSISEEIFKGRTFSTTAQRKRKDGSLLDVLIYGVPVLVKGKTIAIFGIYVDITDRKQAEGEIKKSLKEKEVLLAEIHHRVKNNLAVITGLLELQQYNTSSEEAKYVLRDSQLRIHSIALIHEKLYQNENLSQISIDVYLKELVDIISSMASDETDISIIIDSASIFLTINQAIPCGLILNELITNSYKHAFEGKKEGSVMIKLKKDENMFSLLFKDDGKGLPKDLDIDNSTTLGLTLIKTLSKQLRGRYNFDSTEEGMQFSLNFELDK